jgi:kumamolisin
MPPVPRNYTRLAGSERKPAPGARLLGPADDAETMTVTIALRRRPDGAPVPDMSEYLTKPPSQRRRLSAEEFAEKYGADPADIEKVTSFLRRNDLTVDEVNPARRTIAASGTVAQFSKAFAVELGQYEHEVSLARGAQRRTETYRGRDGFIHVPRALDGIIVGVFGLDNRRISKRASADPPNTTTVSVPEVTQLYDFPPNFAAGQTIAILSEDGYALGDLHQYNTTLPATYSVPDPTDITVRGPGNLGFDPAGETTQDISIAGAAARGASIAVYFTTYDQVGWVDLMLRVVHPDPGDPICSVLSTSFYVSNGDDSAELAREGVTTAWLNAFSAALEDAAIQGVTFVTVSGDYGVNPSAYGGAVSDGKQHVVYPGSDPWALCCGGTTIGNVVGSTFDEYVWNDPAPGQLWGATGGGVSDFFNFLPSYQVDAGVPVSLKDGHVGRGVPDVAANASYNSGYNIIIGGNPAVGNGTSAAAPLWAALIALVNAALGESVGFVNPVLYALGSSVFRDIVAPPGPIDNSDGGVAGYPAGVGWDACTGWGSPNGVALLQGLKGFYGPAIAVDLQDGLQFGTVCDRPKFLTLRVFNVGTRDLMVLGVQSIGSSDFSVLTPPSLPLAIAPGDQVDFTIEYDPTTRGVPETATIQITSNDPVTPIYDVTATGTGGTGRAATLIADHGNFGACCVGSFVDECLIVNNDGSCPLSIRDVTSSSSEFLAPSVGSYPLVVAPGASIDIPIRFRPTSFGAKCGTITVFSDDPAGPKVVRVSGDAPAGKLVITGSTCFGEVPACCYEERTISICNVGDCKLTVSSVAFKHDNPAWKLINDPFPAVLHPGSGLALVICYHAIERFPRPCELVITSDDPTVPVKTLELLGATIWDDRGRCCGECRSRRCEKRHHDPCGCDPCRSEAKDCC